MSITNISFERALANLTEEKSTAFTDQLYRLVWKDRRVDLLKAAFQSDNQWAEAAGLFVLEECAELSEMERIEGAILNLASGYAYQRIAFIKFCWSSGFFTGVMPSILMDLFDSTDLVLRRYAIEYVSRLPHEQFSEVGKKVLETTDYSLFHHQRFDYWQKTTDRKIRAFRIAIMLALDFTDKEIEMNIELEDSISVENRGRRPLSRLSDDQKAKILTNNSFRQE